MKLDYRGYKAAAHNRLTQDWPGEYQTLNSVLRMQLPIVRARSRQLAMDNDYINRFLAMIKRNVVGPKGIGLQLRTGKPELDQHIERQWQRWQKDPLMSGQMNFREMLLAALEMMIIDGEVLLQIIHTAQGIRLHLWEADYLDHSRNQELTTRRRIVNGVEINGWGRVLAYWMLERHPGDYGFAIYGNQYPSGGARRVPSNGFIHLYNRSRSTKNRGVPMLVTIMQSLHHLAGYEQSAVIAARSGACKMGFISRKFPENHEIDPDNTNTPPMMEMQSGSFEVLPDGYEFREFDPSYPNNEFDPFRKSVLRSIASGLDVSYNIFANDLSDVNYSSIRQGALDDRDMYRMWQYMLIERVCQPIFEVFIEHLSQIGELGANIDPGMLKDAAIWQPRGWSWVDPLKDVKAAGEALERGLTSPQQVMSEQGRDIDEIYSQIAQSRKLAESYGLNFGKAPAGKDAENAALLQE